MDRRAGGARGAGGLGTGGPRAAGRDTPGEPWEWAARDWRGGYTENAVGVGGPGGRGAPYGCAARSGGLREDITWKEEEEEKEE